VNSDPANVSHDHPDTVPDSQGNVWVVWDQATAAGDTDVYVAKAAADADGFGQSVQIVNDTNTQSYPVIARDGNNKLYVAWQDNRNGNWDIYFSSSTDGQTWTAATPVYSGAGDQMYPDILTDSQNNVYVVWQDSRNGNWDIYGAMTADGGATWQHAQITNDPAAQTQPRGAADGNDEVYVVWTDARSGNGDIYGAAVGDQGVFTPVLLAGGDDAQSSPVIAAESPGSTLHLAYVQARAGASDIMYRTGNGLAGLAAAAAQVVTDDGDDSPAGETNYNQAAPDLAVFGSGATAKAFCVWQDYRNGAADPDIYYAESGSPFHTNILLNDDGTAKKPQSWPKVGVLPASQNDQVPYAVWTDERNGRKDIYGVGAVVVKDPKATSTVGAAGGTVEVNGATVGVPDVGDDASVTIPAGALAADVTITIHEVENAPPPPAGGIGVMYEFLPSGLTFDAAVTVRIPVTDAEVAGMNVFTVYWYNTATGLWSSEGISNVQLKSAPNGQKYIEFQVTHFTAFNAAAGVQAAGGGGGGGGGGGCATSVGSGDLIVLLLPYAVVALLAARRLRRMARVRP
jgi:hypothetical protein